MDLFSVGHFFVDVFSVDVISVDLFSYNLAVPSVTRCRCCCCGHRFYIAIHQVSLLSHAACAIAVVVVVVVDIDAKAARDSTASDIW